MSESLQNQQSYHEPPVNPQGKAFDPDTTEDERNNALFLHLSLLAHIALPIVSIAIPIVIWEKHKQSSPFLDDHGREAINFQITLLIYSTIIGIITIPVAILTLGVGLLLPVFFTALAIVGMIKAAVAATKGEFYRYPMTIRFLK